MSPRELFSFQIPCSFFAHTHQVSYYVGIASFSAKGLSRSLRIVLKLFHGFLPLFQFSAPHIPVAQALQLLSLSHQVTNMPVPCLRCLSSHHDANLPPGREAGLAHHSPCLFPTSEIIASVNHLKSGDYCPVYSFQFPRCLWQGDSSRPSYSIRIRTLLELDFL